MKGKPIRTSKFFEEWNGTSNCFWIPGMAGKLTQCPDCLYLQSPALRAVSHRKGASPRRMRILNRSGRMSSILSGSESAAREYLISGKQAFRISRPNAVSLNSPSNTAKKGILQFSMAFYRLCRCSWFLETTEAGPCMRIA